jgi:hypothetical protein
MARRRSNYPANEHLLIRRSQVRVLPGASGITSKGGDLRKTVRLMGMRSGGATFAEAAAEWLRFIEQDRDPNPRRSSGGHYPAGPAEELGRFGRSPEIQTSCASLRIR